MMKDNWLKIACMLLVGFIIGLFSSSNVISNNNSEVVVDTLIMHDTVYVSLTPTRHSVLKELNRQNVPHANIVLAQSIHETGNYTSRLCKTHNNIFGIKSGNSYKKYDSYHECITDYKERISSKYTGGDYYEFLIKMRYAEDPLYVQKLKKIVQRT